MTDAARTLTHFDRVKKLARWKPPVFWEDMTTEQQRSFEPPAREPYVNKQAAERVEGLMRLKLSDQERRAVELMLVHGNRRDVWKRLGLSESRLSQIFRDIRRKAKMKKSEEKTRFAVCRTCGLRFGAAARGKLPAVCPECREAPKAGPPGAGGLEAAKRALLEALDLYVAAAVEENLAARPQAGEESIRKALLRLFGGGANAQGA